ncbi:MAG: YfhO family protein [Acidobacteria bacterium]|nr:YfhO family protein [Acidobacteriota bacterium]
MRALTRTRAAHTLAVVGAFALLFTAFFSPALFTHRLLAPGDGALYFLPAFLTPRAAWDASIWLGTPALADPQALAWYPPALLCRLLPPALGWNLFMLAAYVLAASATYGYTFTLTRSRAAAAFAGTTFALSGALVSHAVHPSLIHVAAWMPLLVWSLEIIARRRRIPRAWLVVGAASVALSALAGHPQTFAYTILLGAGLALFRSPRARAGRRRYLAAVSLVFVLGTGLAALQLLPSAELARESVRASLDFEAFTAYQLPLRQLPTLIFPFLYGGSPRTFYATPYFGAWSSESGGWNASELCAYVGLLALILAAVALFARRRRDGWQLNFWSGVALVALLLALGSATPLAFVAYRLPFVNKFRAPARHLVEFSFALSVLAGFGVAAIQRRAASATLIKRVALAAIAVVLLCLAALALYRGQIGAQAQDAIGRAVSIAPWRNPATLLPLCLLAAACASLVAWSRRPASRARLALVFAVLACDLASVGFFSEWRFASPDASIVQPPPAALRLRDALAATRQRILTTRGALGTPDELPPNLSKLWGVESASGYGPLIQARAARLLDELPHGAVADTWANNDDRSLDLAAVRYVLAPRDDSRTNDGAQPNVTSDLNLSFGKGCNAARESVRLALPAPVRATRLAFVSQLACSDQLADAAPVLAVALTDTRGRTSRLDLRAGRDTSEWAYDCPDVRARIRHSRAQVFSTYPTAREPAPCAGHDYATEIATDSPAEIKTIELRWEGGDAASLALRKLTLVDAERGASLPVTPTLVALADGSRWRLAEEDGGARVYENLRARPRAWLVGEVLSLGADDALSAIKTGRLADGRAFDPARTALVEEPQDFTPRGNDAGARDGGAPPSNDEAQAFARVVEVSGSSVAVETRAPARSLLVLSDADYPGWRASVDGQDVRLYRADYALRGVFVPAGAHAVRFEFHSRSFRNGLVVSCVALAALVAFVALPNPISNAKPRRARARSRHADARARRPASRVGSALVALVEGRYAEKSRAQKIMLSLAVFAYPLVYLANMIVRADGRYTGIDNDFGYAYYNYKVYLLAALSRLRFPLWSPAEGGGFPFFSSPLPASVYPFNAPLAIFYRVAGGYTQYDHQVFTVLGVCAFALGLFRWLSLMPLRLRAVLFATLVMCVSFKVTETMRFPNSTQTAAWYPWVLFAVTQIFLSETLRRALKYGLLLALFLVFHLTGGYPYFVYYTLFLVPPYLLIFVVPTLRRALWRRRVASLRRSLAVCAASAALALVVCAPYLYQTARLMRATVNRAGGDFRYATEHEFRPVHTVGSLLFPPASQPEGWYYFGALPLLLLLLYFFAGRTTRDGLSHAATNTHAPDDDSTRRPDRAIKIFFLAWFALVSYTTYGRRSYLFLLLFKLAPLFASLRVWGRLNIVLVPVLAWLLAHAYAAFEHRLFGVTHTDAGGRPTEGSRADATDRAARADATRQLAVLAACYAVVLCAQLFFLRRGLYDFYWARLSDFAHLRGKEPLFVLAGFAAFATVASPLLLARARRLDTRAAPALVLAACVIVTALDTRPVGSRTWTYEATATPRVSRDISAELRRGFDSPRADEEELIPTVPRFNAGVMVNWYYTPYVAFLYAAAREPEARRVLLGLTDGRKVFLSRAIAHDTVAAFLADSASFGGAARAVSYTGDDLSLDVDAPAAGFVSFIDNYDPDWRASVDGRPVEIERLFGTFKSVRVPAGKHRVVFSYRPRFFGWLAGR